MNRASIINIIFFSLLPIFTLYLKIKYQMFIISHSSCRSGLWEQLSYWFWFYSKNFWLRHWPRLQSSEGLTQGGRSISKLAYMAIDGRLQFLSMWAIPYNIAAGFHQSDLQERERKRNQDRSHGLFYNLILKPGIRSNIPSFLPYSTGCTNQPWYI